MNIPGRRASRILAWLLTITLIIGMVPTAVLAEAIEGGEELPAIVETIETAEEPTPVQAEPHAGEEPTEGAPSKAAGGLTAKAPVVLQRISFTATEVRMLVDSPTAVPVTFDVYYEGGDQDAVKNFNVTVAVDDTSIATVGTPTVRKTTLVNNIYVSTYQVMVTPKQVGETKISAQVNYLGDGVDASIDLTVQDAPPTETTFSCVPNELGFRLPYGYEDFNCEEARSEVSVTALPSSAHISSIASTNASVARVVAPPVINENEATFVVEPRGAGECDIVIDDIFGNSITIPVTVTVDPKPANATVAFNPSGQTQEIPPDYEAGDTHIQVSFTLEPSGTPLIGAASSNEGVASAELLPDSKVDIIVNGPGETQVTLVAADGVVIEGAFHLIVNAPGAATLYGVNFTGTQAVMGLGTPVPVTFDVRYSGNPNDVDYFNVTAAVDDTSVANVSDAQKLNTTQVDPTVNVSTYRVWVTPEKEGSTTISAQVNYLGKVVRASIPLTVQETPPPVTTFTCNPATLGFTMPYGFTQDVQGGDESACEAYKEAVSVLAQPDSAIIHSVTSSNPGVARVDNVSITDNNVTFDVKPYGMGNCEIRIVDTLGYTVAIPVAVTEGPRPTITAAFTPESKTVEIPYDYEPGATFFDVSFALVPDSASAIGVRSSNASVGSAEWLNDGTFRVLVNGAGRAQFTLIGEGNIPIGGAFNLVVNQAEPTTTTLDSVSFTATEVRMGLEPADNVDVYFDVYYDGDPDEVASFNVTAAIDDTSVATLDVTSIERTKTTMITGAYVSTYKVTVTPLEIGETKISAQVNYLGQANGVRATIPLFVQQAPPPVTTFAYTPNSLTFSMPYGFTQDVLDGNADNYSSYRQTIVVNANPDSAILQPPTSSDTGVARISSYAIAPDNKATIHVMPQGVGECEIKIVDTLGYSIVIPVKVTETERPTITAAFTPESQIVDITPDYEPGDRTFEVTFELTPSTASAVGVVSSDPTVASATNFNKTTSSFTVIVNGEGEAQFTLVGENGDPIEGAFPVIVRTVVQPVEEIYFNTTLTRLLVLKGTYRSLPSVVVLPADADDKTVTYVSERPEIASVEDPATGIVFGESVGEAQIQAVSSNGLRDFIIVEVIDPADGVKWLNGNVALYPGDRIDMPYQVIGGEAAGDPTFGVAAINGGTGTVHYIDGVLYARETAVPGSQYELSVEIPVLTYDSHGNPTIATASDRVLVSILAPVDSLMLIDMFGNPYPDGAAITGAVGDTIIIGAELTCDTYIGEPLEPNDKRIDWNVSDATVAKVEPIYADGEQTNLARLTFLKKGTATVTATSRQNVLARDDALIKVNEKLVELTLNPDHAFVYPYEVVDIEVNLDPPDTNMIDKLQYVVNDPAIASVDQSGHVLPLWPGHTFITVIYNDGVTTYHRIFVLDVKNPVRSLAATTPVYLNVGNQYDAAKTVKFTGMDNTKDVYDETLTWTVKDSAIADVDANGIITAKASGKTYVYATAHNGVQVQIEVIVLSPAEDLFLDPTEAAIWPGDMITVSATLYPEGSTDDVYWWTPSNSIEIANRTQPQDAIQVTGLIPGTAKIYAFVLKDGETLPGTLSAAWINGHAKIIKNAYITVNTEVEYVAIGKMDGSTKYADGEKIKSVTGTSIQVSALFFEDEACSTPNDPTDKSVTWAVAEGNIAKVEPIEGNPTMAKLTFLAPGVTTLTLRSVSKPDAFDTIQLHVGLGLEDMTLTPAYMEVYPGEDFYYTLALTPEDAVMIEDKLTWSTNNGTVAYIEGQGHLIPVAPGAARITVTYTDPFNGNTYSRTATVIVKQPVTSLLFNEERIVKYVGDYDDLYARLIWNYGMTVPADKTIRWVVEDDTVVSVDETGNMKALKVGETNVYAYAHNDVFARIQVLVKSHSQDLFLDPYLATIWPGEMVVIRATLHPEDSTDDVYWWTADTGIVEITNFTQLQKGIQVTGLAAGTAKITAFVLNDGIVYDPALVNEGWIEANAKYVEHAYITVNTDVDYVAIGKADGITKYADGERIKAVSGSNIQVSALFFEDEACLTPNNPTDKSVTWAVTDETVATVEPIPGNPTMAKLTFHAPGITTLTLRSVHNPNAFDTISLRVGLGLEDMTLTPAYMEVYPGEDFYYTLALTPEDAIMIEDKLTWGSSDGSVAYIEGQGHLIPVKPSPDPVTISVTYTDPFNGNTYTRTATVVVKQDVTSLLFVPDEITKNVGEYEDLYARLIWNYGMNIPADKAVRWVVEDPSIVSVDANGNMKALKVGDTNVYAYAYNDVFARMHVIVTSTAEDLFLDPYLATIWPGEMVVVRATLYPADSTDDVYWWTPDVGIVEITNFTQVQKGIQVTGRTAGTATIYAFVLKDGVTMPSTPISAAWIAANAKLTEYAYITVNTDVDYVAIGKADGITKYEDDETIKAVTGSSIQVSALFFENAACTIPNNPTDKNVTWAIAEESIATVEPIVGNPTMAKLIFHTPGITTLTLRSVSKPTAFDTIEIHVGLGLEDMKLTPAYKEVYPGEDFMYTLELTPPDAIMLEDKLTWASSDGSVAYIEGQGHLIPVAPGTATISVTYTDPFNGNTYTRTATVVVKQDVTSLEFVPAQITKYVGEYEDLYALLVWNGGLTDPADKSVRWVIEDASVVSVDANGNMKALKVGNTNVYAYAYNNIFARIHVTVLQNAEKLVLDAYNVSIYPGEQVTVNATVFPELATDTFVWEIKPGEDKFSVVNQDTGIGNRWITIQGEIVGKTSFDAVLVDGANGSVIRKTVHVTVKSMPTTLEVDSVYPEAVGATYPKTVTARKLNQVIWLTATLWNEALDPRELAADQRVTWESLAEDIATVDANGAVTTHKAGMALIKATSVVDPTVFGYIHVLVIKDDIQMDVDPDEMTLKPGERGNINALIYRDGVLIDDYYGVPDAIDYEITSFEPLDGDMTTPVISITTAVNNKTNKYCIVTAEKPGVAYVTTTFYKDQPEYTRQCVTKVIVTNPVTSVNMAKKYLTILKGEMFAYDLKKDLTFTSWIDGLEPTNKNVFYNIVNENIVRIDEYQRIIGLEVGGTQIDIISEDNPDAKCTIYVEVVDIPTGIFSDVQIIEMYPDDEVLIHLYEILEGSVYEEVTVAYEDYYGNPIADGEAYATFKWDDVNNDGDITTVDGLIRGISPTTNFKDGFITMVFTMTLDQEVLDTYFGDALHDYNWNYLMQYFPEEVSARIRVYVLEPVTGVDIDNITPDVINEAAVLNHTDALTINVNDQYILQASLTPDYEESPGLDRELIWTSSDPTTVLVNPFGVITALRPGTARIYATSKQNTSVQDYIDVNVAEPKEIKVGKTIICDAIVRDKPATSGRALYRVKRGSTVYILGEVGNWYAIQRGAVGGSHDLTAGYAYLPKRCVKITGTITPTVVNDPTPVTVRYNALTNRKAKIYNTDPDGVKRVYTVPKGTKLLVISSSSKDKYLYVEFGYGADIGSQDEKLTGRILKAHVSRVAGYGDGEYIELTYASVDAMDPQDPNITIIDPSTGAQIETGPYSTIEIPATITATSAPVYSSLADAPGIIMGRVYQGAQVTIVSQLHLGYYQIRLANGTVCWINQIYLKKNDNTRVVDTYTETVTKAKVKTTVTMRATASKKGKKLGKVVKGEIVTVTGPKTNGYYPITTEGGLSGYVYSKYLKVYETDVTVEVREQVIETLGSPNCRILNVRNEPSITNSTIVGTLHNSYYYNDYYGTTNKYESDVVKVISSIEGENGEPEWYHIIMPNDRYGWVKAEYLNVYER
ncbi:MAG: Ig-like domain-containing protein [Christensenellales bacterium]|jgi:uncharacterized protein YjdB